MSGAVNRRRKKRAERGAVTEITEMGLNVEWHKSRSRHGYVTAE